jgi:hypothetical protein
LAIDLGDFGHDTVQRRAAESLHAILCNDRRRIAACDPSDIATDHRAPKSVKPVT